jgi:peptidoglycan-associated lipoprotein
MKFKQWMQTCLVATGFLMLAACATHKTPNGSDINLANAASNGGATSNALGQESGFGDKAGDEQISSKRIYYFDFDSTVVHEQDKPAIVANADYLLAHPNVKAMLEGHTDPRGSREYNIGLGERRAKAVAAIMIAKGVSPSQLRIVSYGAEKLASAGHTEADYEQDRRSVVVHLQS